MPRNRKNRPARFDKKWLMVGALAVLVIALITGRLSISFRDYMIVRNNSAQTVTNSTYQSPREGSETFSFQDISPHSYQWRHCDARWSKTGSYRAIKVQGVAANGNKVGANAWLGLRYYTDPFCIGYVIVTIQSDGQSAAQSGYGLSPLIY